MYATDKEKYPMLFETARLCEKWLKRNSKVVQRGERTHLMAELVNNMKNAPTDEYLQRGFDYIQATNMAGLDHPPDEGRDLQAGLDHPRDEGPATHHSTISNELLEC